MGMLVMSVDLLLTVSLVGIAVGVLVGKGWRRWRARARFDGFRLWPWILLCSVVVVAAVVVPIAAGRLAERSTGWVDADHDGMLDGFVNGGYDWFDVNAGALAVRWSIGWCLIAGGFAAAARWIERRQLPAPGGASPT